MKLLFVAAALSATALLSQASVQANDSAVNNYLSQVGSKIGEFYFPVPGATGAAVASFVIDRNGYTYDPVLLQDPTTLARAEEAGKKSVFVAIRNAAPFSKPPAELQLPVRMTVTLVPSKDMSKTASTVNLNDTQVAGKVLIPFQ
jgi:hypothetical protein